MAGSGRISANLAAKRPCTQRDRLTTEPAGLLLDASQSPSFRCRNMQEEAVTRGLPEREVRGLTLEVEVAQRVNEQVERAL